jgi:hypothetical protein
VGALVDRSKDGNGGRHLVRRHAKWKDALPVAVIALATSFLFAAPTPGQIVGQNVNMVAGTHWPGGDPFLQRQNEPSLAVSTRNSLHLLAGANDYRTVDLPGLPGGEETGDAWLGVFKSFDGGQTWQSTLLPGYPQDPSAVGLASVLKGFTAAADPVVRPGTNGLFYYSGIVFNRGTNVGEVFVSRFIDLDNKENGDVTQGLDTIKYLDATVIDSGTSGQFLDKPWVTADVPRPGAGQCTINVSPMQTFAAGNVYMAYAMFTGSQSTKIMFTRSLDCGATWSKPTKLSESNSINQGTTIAVDPLSGALYVAWRRFATSSQSDAIVIAKSTNFGKTFTKASDVATIIPFDQGSTTTSFRTESLPTIAVSVDSGNTSHVHLAWAARSSAGADVRIYLTTSLDGTVWSNPVPVDSGPLVDDFGNSFDRGHQFMPQLTFAAGRLMLLYYDTRLDHTLGLFYPNFPFEPDPDTGSFYMEERAPRGELPSNPSLVYTPYLDDAGLTLFRHTIDVRVAEAVPSSSPAFTTARVSQYRFGTRGDEQNSVNYLQQLQVDPPDLPLFAQGTLAFIGDYIDIAGQAFLPPATAGGSWTYNLAPSEAPVFYATWTTNQDVRPPADGDWTHYTPVGGGGPSVFDPMQTTPACSPGQEGMRNQNIYSARISEGLVVTSPQNNKPLSTTLTRAFVILVRNATKFDKTFHLTIANQPAGGDASFVRFPSLNPPVTTLDVEIPARSGIVRPVFATSSDPSASITINVNETDSVGGAIINGGLSSFVILNQDATTPALVNPDGGSGENIYSIEVYNPNVSNPNVSNPNVSNPNVSNPNVSNPNVSNPNVSNPNVSNPDIADPNVSNPNVSNPNVSNPNVSNPNVSNPNISNASISDATYTVTNAGNTSASYRVKLVGNYPNSGANLQLIISKVYQTPISINCQLEQEQANEVVANIINPAFGDASDLTDPDIQDPSPSNATFYLRPGETALVTLRGTVDSDEMDNVVTQVAPVVISQASPTYAVPLFISIAALPNATFGTDYSQTLQAIGGTAPYHWSVVSGSLPGGLTLHSTTAQITGTPTSAGTSTFTVKVTDSGSPSNTNTRYLSLTVDQAGTTLSLASSPNPSVFGESVTFTGTVTAAAPAMGTPGGTVTFSDGTTTLGTTTLSGGSAAFTTSALAVGSHSVTATYAGDGDFTGSTSAAVTETVNKASTVTSLVSSSNPSVPGQPVTFTATLSAVAPGAGTPTGTVTFKDGATMLGTATLAGGTAAFTTSALLEGSHSITASYGGDGSFLASTSGVLPQLVRSTYLFTGFLSPLSTAGSYASPTYSGTFNLARGVPIKWQLQDANGNYINDLSTTSLLQAVQNVGCPGVPGTQTIVLYSPTTGAKGGSTFRSGNNQFIFNWDTSSGTATGCYTLLLQLADGTQKATIVQLN